MDDKYVIAVDESGGFGDILPPDANLTLVVAAVAMRDTGDVLGEEELVRYWHATDDRKNEDRFQYKLDQVVRLISAKGRVVYSTMPAALFQTGERSYPRQPVEKGHCRRVGTLSSVCCARHDRRLG